VARTGITDAQIDAWVQELGLSEAARAQIKFMNSSPPVRNVGGSRSVAGTFPSTIMKCALQFESHKCELLCLWLAHYRYPTRMVLDQPCDFPIEYTDADGRKRSFTYTPDFFWLGDRAEFIECKREDELIELTDLANPKAQPWRYVRVGPGHWRCPPGEEAAKKLGLGFRVFTPAEASPILFNNLQFLADYYDAKKTAALDAAAAGAIENIVKEHPGIQIREIIEGHNLVNGDVDTLYLLVALGRIYINLEDEPLSPNFSARLYPNRELAESAAIIQAAAPGQPVLRTPAQVIIRPGANLILDRQPATVVDMQGDIIVLSVPGGTRQMLLTELERRIVAGDVNLPRSCNDEAVPGPAETVPPCEPIPTAEWSTVSKKFLQIQPYIDAHSKADLASLPPKTRSQRRYCKQYYDALTGNGNGLHGLRDRPRRGNTRPRLDARVEEIIATVLDEVFLSKAAPSIEFVFGECSRRCQANVPPLSPPTRRTLYARIKAINGKKVLERREGQRSAYKMDAPYWDDEWDGLSIDGEHSWAVAHIDHTQLDVTTPPTADGLSLGRPWLTSLVLPKYKRSVARHISYEPPSYRACMAVIYDCVRRHHRLPRIMVVDNGAEFRSAYFDQLLAMFEIIKKLRLPARPRFGAVLERTNCTVDTRLLHNLLGNTKLTKQVRLLTKSHNPERLAVLPLAELRDTIDKFYCWLETQPDSLTGISPLQAFERDLKLGGPRNHKIIVPDEMFKVLTLPTTRNGRATVNIREGVIINHIPYWCEEFRDPRLSGQSLPVRYDPNDASTAHVEIGGRWTRCRCRRFQRYFQGLTEREVQAASAELLRAATTLKEKRRAVTATSLATFFERHGLRRDVRQRRERAKANQAPNDPATSSSPDGAAPSQTKMQQTTESAAAAPPETRTKHPAFVPKRRQKTYPIGFSNAA
jgi:transposase InsO family protein